MTYRSDPYSSLTAEQRTLAYEVAGTPGNWPGSRGHSDALKAALRSAAAPTADKIAVAELFGGEAGAAAARRWAAEDADGRTVARQVDEDVA